MAVDAELTPNPRVSGVQNAGGTRQERRGSQVSAVPPRVSDQRRHSGDVLTSAKPRSNPEDPPHPPSPDRRRRVHDTRRRRGEATLSRRSHYLSRRTRGGCTDRPVESAYRRGARRRTSARSAAACLRHPPRAALTRGALDLVIDFHGGPRSAWLTWATRAEQRIGYNVPGRGWIYTTRIPWSRSLVPPRHSVGTSGIC